ncbi:MAG: 4-aminobutyrate--2-oxoglutarate transaminase [Candidatus Bipolaricaulota bacterium]|nr:4-aminobutyrate--2-oxoglutarate transaminase [Candidatus Bipolaricaulota bacterium]MDW8126786.1 4-aminobutyrate--2-oxoglutarate transaminase [Candidatus Bipolaricaulota bacterium]
MGKYIRIVTEIPGPKSRAVMAEKERWVARPLHPLAPFFVAKAEGTVVEDLDGNRFLDFTGGWGCLNVGHNHPKVLSAVRAQIERYTHTDFTAVPYTLYVELSRRLAQLAPGPTPKKCALFNSGAEAVENAVKIARAATGRKAVLVFENAFHGRTLLTMTMTHKAIPYKAGFGPYASDVFRLPYPYPYRNPIPMEEIERRLLALVDPKEVACCVVEPVIGEGGFIVPPPEFLPFLRELANRYGFLLVCDEVQSGVGRTGKFFACEHFGVEPDLICVAKSIAAGLPLSAVIGKAEIMDALIPGAIGSTYGGNPVACAAALAVLDVIEEENLLARADHLGRIIRRELSRFMEKFPVIGEVRGLGAMVGIELVRDKKSKEPAPELTKSVQQEALHRGVLFATAGLHGNVIRFLLPLTTPDDALLEGLAVLEDAFQTVLARIPA